MLLFSLFTLTKVHRTGRQLQRGRQAARRQTHVLARSDTASQHERSSRELLSKVQRTQALMLAIPVIQESRKAHSLPDGSAPGCSLTSPIPAEPLIRSHQRCQRVCWNSRRARPGYFFNSSYPSPNFLSYFQHLRPSKPAHNPPSFAPSYTRHTSRGQPRPRRMAWDNVRSCQEQPAWGFGHPAPQEAEIFQDLSHPHLQAEGSLLGSKPCPSILPEINVPGRPAVPRDPNKRPRSVLLLLNRTGSNNVISDALCVYCMYGRTGSQRGP